MRPADSNTIPDISAENQIVPPLARTRGMSSNINALTARIIGAAIAVHRELGPGMLESAYEACLAFDLLDRGLAFERQKALPIVYRGHRLDCGYRIDLLVKDEVIVEVKAVE